MSTRSPGRMPGGPHDPGVCLADPCPVLGAEAEHGRTTGGPAGAVDAGHGLRGDAEVVAEGRARRLGGAQLVLGHDGKPAQVSQASERVGRDAGGLPLLPVEGASRPRVANLVTQLGEDQIVAHRGRRALDLGQPVLGVGRRAVAGVVSRRPYGEVHAAGATDRVEIEGPHERPAEAEASRSPSAARRSPPAREPGPPGPPAASPGGRPRPRRSGGGLARPRPG